MAEKPILFSTPMVKAILSGSKTQTRRIIKNQPLKPVPMGFVIASGRNSDIGKFCFGYSEIGGHNTEYFKPPYKVGDILWVRETWCKGSAREGGPKIIYKADIEDLLQQMHEWKPSIHMPRSAARLFLKVTDVRVEQLHDITEDGAKAEGIKQFPIVDAFSRPTGMYVYGDTGEYTAKEAFKRLWADIYKKWDNGLWVWAIEFERQ
jgi:hypothetical protein